VIARRVRAFDPFPGAQAVLAGETVKLWAAQAHPAGTADALGEALPGQVLVVGAEGIGVQTGKGTLQITELQRPGGRRLPVSEFLRGHRIDVGQVFDAAAERERH
jgi:methionyl-tRNA formyltransferase